MDQGAIPPPPGVVPDFGRRSNNDARLLAADVICLALAAFCFLLRIYSRFFISRSLSWDDFFCMIAMVLAIAFSVSVAATLPSGTGEHLWNLRLEDVVGDSMYKWPLITTMLYLAAMSVLKISVLLLYLRLFSVNHRAKVVIRLTIGIVVTFSVAILFLYLFGCQPLKGLWSSSPEGRCLDQASVLLGTAALNMGSNFLTLVIPLPLVWRLQTSRKERIATMAVLGAGALVCSTCGFRLWTLVRLGQTNDTTFALFHYYLASVIELNGGVVLACVPALTALVKRHLRSKSSAPSASTSVQKLERVQSRPIQSDEEISVSATEEVPKAWMV